MAGCQVTYGCQSNDNAIGHFLKRYSAPAATAINTKKKRLLNNFFIVCWIIEFSHKADVHIRKNFRYMRVNAIKPREFNDYFDFCQVCSSAFVVTPVVDVVVYFERH